MSKLFKLKEWLTLEEAAEYLTLKIGETVDVNAIMDIVRRRKLPVGVYIDDNDDVRGVWADTYHEPTPSTAPITLKAQAGNKHLVTGIEVCTTDTAGSKVMSRDEDGNVTCIVRNREGFYIKGFYRHPTKRFNQHLPLSSVPNASVDISGNIIEDAHGTFLKINDSARALPVIDPADLDTLAEKLNDTPADQEPTPKAKNSYLRTIDALATALIRGSSGQPHSDANAVEAELASIGVSALPVKPKRLAKYLEEARGLD